MIRRASLVIATGAIALLTAASTEAASWRTIRQREYMLTHRIDEGIRNGSLNRREARQLNSRYRNLTWLEHRYRRSGGLSDWERTDLDRRFDALSRSIRMQRHDAQRRWR